MDPITYPTVQVGGETFKLKFRHQDLKRLADEEHIDLFDVPLFSQRLDNETVVPLRGLDLMDRTIRLFSHGVRHERDLSVSAAADLISIRELPDVIDAVKLAMSKVSAQATATVRTPGIPSQVQ